MNLPPPPPDAGASTLGAYTLRNAWVMWMLHHDPTLLASPPSELYKTDLAVEGPACLARAEHVNQKTNRWVKTGRNLLCHETMLARPGMWVCYQHGTPVRVNMKLKLKPMRLYDAAGDPLDDVLSLIGKDVDVEYREKKWRVVKRAS